MIFGHWQNNAIKSYIDIGNAGQNFKRNKLTLSHSTKKENKKCTQSFQPQQKIKSKSKLRQSAFQ